MSEGQVHCSIELVECTRPWCHDRVEPVCRVDGGFERFEFFKSLVLFAALFLLCTRVIVREAG